MKFKVLVFEAQAFPRFYGCAYRDHMRCAKVCFPLGVHWVAGIAHELYWRVGYWVVMPPFVRNRWKKTMLDLQATVSQKELARAWQRGYRDCQEYRRYEANVTWAKVQGWSPPPYRAEPTNPHETRESESTIGNPVSDSPLPNKENNGGQP